MLPLDPQDIKNRFGSIEGMARQLIAHAPGLAWPQPRSLAAKLGQLRKGEGVWWKGRAEHARALAQLLGLAEAELGLRRRDDEQLFSFDDFPELPPLDPALERFCELARPVIAKPDRSDGLDLWFDARPRQLQRQPTSMVWLRVAPGMGGAVLLAELRAQGRFAVHEVDLLPDALEVMRRNAPLVVAPRASGGEDDLLALAQRPEDAGMLVIAPFAAPLPQRRDTLGLYSWDYVSSAPLQRRVLALGGEGGFFERLHAADWRLLPDWQARLLAWVEARLLRHGIDTLFSAEGVRRWLDAFDPAGEWIRTPADLMAVCRISHRLRETRLPKAGDALASRTLLKAMLAPRPGQDALFARMAVARWNALDQPWRRPLPHAAWMELSAPASEADALPALLEIAEGANRAQRRALAQRFAEHLPGAALRALQADGLLAPDALGLLELRPRLLADLAVRDHLMLTIQDGALEQWAPACFDGERRPSVDAALDALGADGLASAWLRLDALAAPDGAHALAAAEALFCAAGRRLLRGGALPPALDALAARVLARLALEEQDHMLPLPWTRALDGEAERCDWIACCWAWSLAPRPALADLGARAGWLFPGWADDEREPPHWLDLPDADEALAAPAWQRLLHAAERLVARRTQPFAHPPALLHHALLAGSASGRWPAQAHWWPVVITRRAIETRLLARLGEIDATMAARLWRAWLQHEARGEEGIARSLAPVVQSRRQILAALAPDAFLGAILGAEWGYLADVVATLPPHLREALFERMPTQALGTGMERAERFFGQWDAGAARHLVRWLETWHVFDAGMRLWALDPDAAIGWIEANADRNPTGASQLMHMADAPALGRALGLLRQRPGLLDAEARLEWAKARLPNAGRDAGAVLALAESALAALRSAC